ncbi:NAD(P)/FAD-dependent oxidoreductase [Williamsia sp.]|uniref:flavin-containing monooxygenase n=1 Tax=Williamsia sp. TaxID=1872085 RepID=UPI002F924023
MSNDAGVAIDGSSRSTLRYAVIGGGAAGILSAVRLRDRGQDNFVVYEKRHRIGGTWQDNRYPGLHCDVPSHAYTYSFAPYAEWKSYFARGPEIRDYFEFVVDKFGVRPWIELNSEVTECIYSDDDGRWHLTLADGRTDVADVVLAASGVLHHPKIPDINGLADFQGQWCHSAQWRDDIETKGKRVGVVGSGSTGTQIVAELTEEAAELVHFSRTPQWILQLPQFDYTDEDRERFRADPTLINEIRYGEDYQTFLKTYYTAVVDSNSPEYQALDATIRQNLEDSVTDPELRERLRPDFLPMCKRLVMSWSYYDAIQRPNAVLETEEIDHLDATGVVLADGTRRDIDTLVLATGFKVDSFIRPTKVLGVNGVDLNDVWEERAVAYRSISVPGFPNMFYLNGPNAPVGNFSLIEIAELQWKYFEHLLDLIDSGECTHVTATPEALDEFETARQAAAKNTIFASGCTSWYLDKQGIPAGWPWSFFEFERTMQEPILADYALTTRVGEDDAAPVG